MVPFEAAEFADTLILCMMRAVRHFTLVTPDYSEHYKGVLMSTPPLFSERVPVYCIQPCV